MSARQTPSQTVGPFFAPAMIETGAEILVSAETRGDRLTIEGRIIDGEGAPVTDAMLEIWQANAEGRYDHPDDDQEKLLDPAFHGYGRAATDARGEFHFHTIKPGAVPGIDGALQAPHINVSIFARGLLKRLATRIYFPDDALNANDPVLKAVPPERRASLIAAWTDSTRSKLRFEVVLQGANETVFLDI
jgi:protocatechuate 3,4-dioxygenase, alpha subunit